MFCISPILLCNYLLGVLDEKQHRERESKDNVGWYHKTDFEITATIGGEDFHYEGRFDIGALSDS